MTEAGGKYFKRKGILMVLSSPSGAGKSTLSRLLKGSVSLNFSTSATTREPRGLEKDGVEYYFLSKEEFKKKIEEGAFIEWAEVHGNYYGTYKSVVEEAMLEGKDLLFDVDFKGMLQLKEKLPDDMVSIFILPPSIEQLRYRLAQRCEDSEEAINQRIANAYEEIKQYKNFEYVLVNQDIDQTYNNLLAIYYSEKLKRRRLLDVDEFVEKLSNEKVL